MPTWSGGVLAEANFSEYMVEDAHVSKVSTFKAIQFNFVVRVISGHVRLRKKASALPLKAHILRGG